MQRDIICKLNLNNYLLNFIDTGLYKRQGKALSNFDRTLPEMTSDLAQEITKDPYNFAFTGITGSMWYRATTFYEKKVGTILLSDYSYARRKIAYKPSMRWNQAVNP